MKHLALGLALLTLSPQTAEIKSARLSVVKKTTAVAQLTVENRRESPVIIMEIGLTEPGAEFARQLVTYDFNSSSENGPIKPHERRTLDVVLAGNPNSSAAVRLAVFEDGYYEGVTVAVNPWLKKRQARFDDLRYWIGALEFIPRGSEADARDYLAGRIADRADHREDTSGMRAKIHNTIRQHSGDLDIWPALNRLRMEAQIELAVASREPAVRPTIVDGALPSVAVVSQQRITSTTVVATLENLREVPIEAWGIERFDAATGRVSGSQVADFCVAEPNNPPTGFGRIQPHEVREIPLGITVTANTPLPAITLLFVIFDDLVAEGDPRARYEALRERQVRAEDFAFAISALDEAVTRPATEIYTFLLGKRVERTKQLGGMEYLGLSMAIDELIRQAKESPAQLIANASRMRERMERTRARLARHLAR